MNRTRVVLADDHALLREGLRILIDSQRDLKVVAEAATGQEVMERVRETQPLILCLDLSIPGWGSVLTFERVKAVSAGTRILVLTTQGDLAYVRSAVASGASGYYLKYSSVSDVLNAIRGVAAGNRVIDPRLQPAFDEASLEHPVGQSANLSLREGEVLKLLVRGHTDREIADKLFVGVKTVEKYHARVREKLGLKTRADFIRYGVDSGLLHSWETIEPKQQEE